MTKKFKHWLEDNAISILAITAMVMFSPATIPIVNYISGETEDVDDPLIFWAIIFKGIGMAVVCGICMWTMIFYILGLLN